MGDTPLGPGQTPPGSPHPVSGNGWNSGWDASPEEGHWMTPCVEVADGTSRIWQCQPPVSVQGQAPSSPAPFPGPRLTRGEEPRSHDLCGNQRVLILDGQAQQSQATDPLLASVGPIGLVPRRSPHFSLADASDAACATCPTARCGQLRWGRYAARPLPNDHLSPRTLMDLTDDVHLPDLFPASVGTLRHVASPRLAGPRPKPRVGQDQEFLSSGTDESSPQP